MKAMIKQNVRALGYAARRRPDQLWSRVLTRTIGQFSKGYNGVLFTAADNGERGVLRACLNPRRRNTPPVVFDVGANRGEWTRDALAVCPTAKVHMFEPNPAHQSELKALAAEHEEVIATLCGIAADEGVRTLRYQGDAHSTASTVDVPANGDGTLRRFDGRFITASRYVGERDIATIDLLKIDVEGADLECLTAFLTSGAEIRAVQFEFTVFSRVGNASLKAFFDLLAPHGFEVFKIFPRDIERISWNIGHEQAADGNYIAVRDRALLEGLEIRDPRNSRPGPER